VIENQVALVFDGVTLVSGPKHQLLQQGGQATYKLLASKAGIFSWRASVAAQAAQGLKGAIVVRAAQDPFSGPKIGELVMALSDARQRPAVCLGAQGASSPACPEIDKATLNGQWGDGSKGWPFPVMEVTKDKCYRMRFVGLMDSETPFFKVSVEDHTFHLIHGESSTKVTEFEVHAGQGVDTMLCADQKVGTFSHDYTMTLSYVGKTTTQPFTAKLRYSTSGEVALLPQVLPLKPADAVEVKEAPELTSDFDISTCDRHQVFDLRDAIVDYLRPTIDLGGKAARQPVDKIPLANRKLALLVNDSYPGPTVVGIEGELICVTVLNNYKADPVSIHWHGQHMKGYPAFDGVYGVTQGAITTGSSFIYRWRANAGTHMYHAHMQALQTDKGLKGAVVIQAKNDPHKHMYTEERIVAMSDEWVNPGTCLRTEGAQPGNPVCAEIEKATFAGQWGDGSDEYPWPVISVEKGKCYRLRFIGMMGQAQNFQITMAGHNMTLIAVDGADVEPVVVSLFNLHAGERADIVVCADQEPGNYLVEANYDLANFLETAPAPKMPRVDSSKFWAFLKYEGHNDKPGPATRKLLGGYNPPTATGGGLSPKAVAGFVWDTNLFSSWTKVKNTAAVAIDEPEEADITYTLDVGIASPAFEAGVTPYAKSDPMFMFTNITTWKKPSTPLLHTKGECGAQGTPYITVPDGAKTVELVINNLSPTAHVLHMHGMRFQVINTAKFSETWCSNAHFECFFIPLSIAKVLDCPGAKLGDARKGGPGSEYWGCPYDKEKDEKTRNLKNPLQKDMISLWRRSWAVIRFKVENPGVWIFHCHMEQHIPTGQIMAFSLLPSQQPPIPKDVPSEGSCPIWSGRMAPVRHKDATLFV